MNIDMEFVRKQFPGLSGEWVLMDNAGGTQILNSVVDRIRDYLLNTNVQLGGTYETSRISTKRVEQGIRTAAELIDAGDKCEVILGSSTSMLLRILSLCLVETFRPGDEVIVTNCDHEANIGPWRSLEKKGMNIKEWKINPDSFSLDLDDLKKLMTDKTRLVAVGHVSNILGSLHPIKEIASFVHKRGAMICVDGVAYAPHRLVDVRDLDVDFYAFSFYKVYGPHYSVLYGKKSILENIPGLNHFFLEDEIPYRFQPGNVNYELAYSLTGIGEYFREFARHHSPNTHFKGLNDSAKLAYEYVAHHEETLSARLLDFLSSKAGVRIIGKKEPDRSQRVPTVSFVVDGMKSSEVTLAVDKHHIGIRYGDFYARRLIDYLGLGPQDGVVRVSLVHYNTIEEVDRLIEVLDTLF